MTARQFRMPDVGEGLTEAEVVTWHVAVGDVVAVNDVLVDIETAKSVVELPSPFAGEVTELLAVEGQTVGVGTPIVTITAADREPMLVGYGPRDEPVQRRRRRRNLVPPPPVSTARVRTTPPVRKLAKDLGIDLVAIAHDGVVTRADVEAAAHPTVPAVRSEERRIPVTGVRRATAEAMVRSATTVPQASAWITVDVSRTMALLDRLRSDLRWSGGTVSPLLMVARATCLALGSTPELNGSWRGDEIVLTPQVDLGIATATDRGLVVPHIRRAEQLTLRDLAFALSDVVGTARAGRAQPGDLAPGSFTLTNIGTFGIDGGTPILAPGESGILAIGAVARRPWVDDHDQVVPRWVCTLALSFDHRIADGVHAARFLADVAAILAEPELALTY